MSRSLGLAAAIVLVAASRSAGAAPPPPETAPPRYPGYASAGVLSLALSATFAGGGVAAAATGNPDTALGLTSLGTVGAAVGVPLVMLGAVAERPRSLPRAAAGIALATPGVLGVGLGAAVLERRMATLDEPDLVVPLALMAAGAAVTVVGIVVWASGRGAGGEAEVTARAGPGGLSLGGSF